MNVRAMFIDMDGTLLTTSNRISYRNMEAIHKLLDRGVKVFLATGRQFEITIPYHQLIGLETPMICLNGASLHDGETGKTIYTKPVRLDEERFHQMTGDHSCNVLIHTAAGLYCKRTNREIDEWTREGQIPPYYVGDLRSAGYDQVLKYSVRTGSKDPQFTSRFKQLFTEEADLIDWDDGFEIVARGVSKWAAIENVLRTYSISPAETVTIGDGPNDIQMLQQAGTGVAMHNASPLVKHAADFVTGHHEEDGLADFIERYLIRSFAV